MRSEMDQWLPWPATATGHERKALRTLDVWLEAEQEREATITHSAIAAHVDTSVYDVPVYEAAARVLIDLVNQGWTLTVARGGVTITQPSNEADAQLEKDRIRRQEHVARDTQLNESSVRRFIAAMEATRLWRGQAVSIFSLMTEGLDLAQSVSHFQAGELSAAAVLAPEIQVVETGAVCTETGMLLTDIWRYFRHTWANPYSTVPGRTMQILVRDTSRPFHPVIGLVALSSPVVQIGVRDQWIGWDTETLLKRMQMEPTVAMAQWLKTRLLEWRTAIWTKDLLLDELLPTDELDWAQEQVVATLRLDALSAGARHRDSRSPELARARESSWEEKAQSALFRGRRSALLADILQAEISLREFLWPRASSVKLAKALDKPDAFKSIRWIIRRAKSERVGAVIADLSVCGALPPYSALAAGKLVAMLASGPTVLQSYIKRYGRPSEIASSIAGRPIVKDARLAYIGTTSLYGSGSSQYNRLFWPSSILGGDPTGKFGYYRIGMSRSYGTSQFSNGTVASLMRLAEVSEGTSRVNSIFGEGVNPRMRKVRSGLDVLGWPGDALLKHGRQRIVYGCPLVSNLSDFAIGIDREPAYLLDPSLQDDAARLTNWWFERWAANRASQIPVIQSMESHSLVHPRRHGAIVPTPVDDNSDTLF